MKDNGRCLWVLVKLKDRNIEVSTTLLEQGQALRLLLLFQEQRAPYSSSRTRNSSVYYTPSDRTIYACSGFSPWSYGGLDETRIIPRR